MSRLSEFTVDELSSIIFAMDIAESSNRWANLPPHFGTELIDALGTRNIDQNA